jgi:hypothetical protein
VAWICSFCPGNAAYRVRASTETAPIPNTKASAAAGSSNHRKYMGRPLHLPRSRQELTVSRGAAQSTVWPPRFERPCRLGCRHTASIGRSRRSDRPAPA